MSQAQATRGGAESRPLLRLGLLPLLLLAGCAGDRWSLIKPAAPPGPADSLVLRGDRLEPEKPSPAAAASKDLAGGRELYRLGEYPKAENVFQSVADNTKNPHLLAEEARFYEAECLLRQLKYPSACDTYNRVLNDFPSGAYREQACQRIYDIADYWLEDTRQEIKAYAEKKEGKRWVVLPAVFHTEKAKPFFDEEGRAIEALEHVRMNDNRGPLADKALFLAGSVKFYREDYREADRYFTDLVQNYPNSPERPTALELGIMAKQMSTGGPEYDGRKVAEARQLINTALNLTHDRKKQDALTNQLASCTMQQAAKDFGAAEFYRRTGHPGSAYFYYEIVHRRYPGTSYDKLATDKMWDLRRALEKEQTAQEAAARAQEEKQAGQRKPAQVEQAPAPRPLPTPGAKPETAPPPRPLPPEGWPAAPEAPPGAPQPPAKKTLMSMIFGN